MDDVLVWYHVRCGSADYHRVMMRVNREDFELIRQQAPVEGKPVYFVLDTEGFEEWPADDLTGKIHLEV